MYPITAASHSSMIVVDPIPPQKGVKRKFEEEVALDSGSARAKELWKKILPLKKTLSFLRNEKSRQISEALLRVPCDFKFLNQELSRENSLYFNRFWKDVNGNTLIHHAAHVGDKKSIDSLDRLKVSLFAKNHVEETPLDIFRNRGHKNTDAEFALVTFPDISRDFKCSDISQRMASSVAKPPFFYPPSPTKQGRIHPGRFATNDFTLFYEGKRRRCEIPDQSYAPDDVLSLHNRMERETALRTKKRSSDSDNFVMASLGIVVSTKPHAQKTENDYQLKFVNLPINHPEYEMFSVKDYKEAVHSERQLYKYLGQKEVLKQLIGQFELHHKIESGCKIYGVILDLYSEREMCQECEGATYDEADEASLKEGSVSHFLQCLEQVCTEKGYILPKKKKDFPPDALTPSRGYSLDFTARVSCSKQFSRGDGPKDSVGISYPAFGNLREKEESLPLTPQARNIKKFRNNVILIRQLGGYFTGLEENFKSAYPTQTLFQNTHPGRYRIPTLIHRKAV